MARIMCASARQRHEAQAVDLRGHMLPPGCGIAGRLAILVKENGGCAALAAQTGIDEDSIKWTLRSHQYLRVDDAAAVARAAGVSLDWLVFGPPHPQKAEHGEPDRAHMVHRLQRAMALIGGPAETARRLGLNPSDLTREWLMETRPPSLSDLAWLGAETGVSLDWLVFGAAARHERKTQGRIVRAISAMVQTIVAAVWPSRYHRRECMS